jgi:hypothetical protein
MAYDQKEKEELINRYREFLDSPYPHTIMICDTCQWYFSHPINYCPKCPGNIKKYKGTYRQEIEALSNHIKRRRQEKQPDARMHGIHMEEFNNFSGIKIEYPSEDYYILWDFYREEFISK